MEKIDINASPHDPGDRQCTKVFFHDFIVRFAVRSERVVFRQLSLRSTATVAASPAMSLTPFAPFWPDVIEDECGYEESEKDSDSARKKRRHQA